MKFIQATLLSLLALSSAACLQPAREQLEPPRPIEMSPPLPAGTYDVQNVRYDDSTGSYQVFIINAPAGHKPVYQHADIKLARLPDEAIAAGKKSHLEVTAEGTALHLTPDFQIAYVHNLTEERIDPATQARETVVVGQQTSTWSPFMSAMTGAMIGNMLFAPRYYYPPPFSAGPMTGYGGVGPTRTMASQAYAQKFGTEPNAVKLSKTGMTPRRVSGDSMRSSGQGVGSSRMKQGAPATRKPRGFGGFGRRRR